MRSITPLMVLGVAVFSGALFCFLRVVTAIFILLFLYSRFQKICSKILYRIFRKSVP
jgi:hypothetical protein